MNHYIVMQGHTYQEEKEAGIIWSPQKDKSGNTPHSWLRMMELKKGDRVFHYVKGNIVAISVAVADCQEAAKPSSMQYYDQWEDQGYLVQLQYHELEVPLNIRAHFNELMPLLPIKYSAFQQDGNGNHGYLYPCNEELSIKLLELISDRNIYQIDEEQLELAIGTVIRTERNTFVPMIAETEAEAKMKIRIGQQKFKRDLLPLWDQKCALCGIELPALLRASHSKPWKDSASEERLDPYNGVLLCCNHDALYDKGYITFDGQGRIHISKRVPEMDYVKYNIHPKMKIAHYENNRPYFKWHKKNIFEI
ncbi:HNH endonuclease [Bacillus cereus]|nr:HNH endonuclease [Bacillus cereus]